MEIIKNLIIHGLLKEVQISERSLRLNKKISQSYNKIDNKNKKDIAYILYDLSYTKMVLALSRLYDKPNRNYPTRCLKRLYEITEEHNLVEDLSKFRKDSELNLHKFGFHPEFIDLLKRDSDDEYILHSTAFFETKEINNPIVGHIEKLKTIRDKLLAHNEDIKIDTLVPYQMTHELIDHAKMVLSFYALTYAGIHLNGGSKFTTDHGSLKWEKVFGRFIEE